MALQQKKKSSLNTIVIIVILNLQMALAYLGATNN